MKCTSREACIKRYGPIDFSSGEWPGKRNWLEMYEVDEALFTKWMIGETKLKVHHMLMNKDMMVPFHNALNNIVNGKLQDLLLTFDGCFNIRMVRGTNDLFSAHSYGLAIDLNCNTNELGQKTGGMYDQKDLVECFTKEGFDWGGDFHGRKDPMHFSWAWE
jgi:hypothetical protein